MKLTHPITVFSMRSEFGTRGLPMDAGMLALFVRIHILFVFLGTVYTEIPTNVSIATALTSCVVLL